MIRLLYSSLFYLAQPLVWLRLAWRARKQPEYLQHLGERYGFHSRKPPAPLLWLHALASGTSDEHATLTLCLAVAGGSVIGGLQRHHFGPDRGVSLGAVVAVAAAWFFAGAFPLLATAPEMVLGGTGVVAGVAWWRGRCQAGGA